MTALEEEPVPYELTEAGWAACRGTMTALEAAAYVGVSWDVIAARARRGDLRGVKVDGSWILDRTSVEEYAEARSLDGQRLPSAPLLRRIALRGGARRAGIAPRSAEEKALERARREGSLTLRTAERLTVALGMTPWEIWGASYDV